MGDAKFTHDSKSEGATTGIKVGLDLGGLMKSDKKKLMLINLVNDPSKRYNPEIGSFDYQENGTVKYNVDPATMNYIEALQRQYVPADKINNK